MFNLDKSKMYIPGYDGLSHSTFSLLNFLIETVLLIINVTSIKSGMYNNLFADISFATIVKSDWFLRFLLTFQALYCSSIYTIIFQMFLPVFVYLFRILFSL